MQSGCSSGYNSMLATNESPCTSASTALMIDASNGEHQAPPRLQVLTNGMAGMQLAANEFKQQMVQGPGSSSQLGFHSQAARSASPLKRQNTSSQSYGSPRVQLEQQQRKRLLEQRQLFASDTEMAGTSRAPESLQNQWRTSQWMQDHHGMPVNDLKDFYSQPAPLSRTGSQLSGMSGFSNLSRMTQLSTLSIDTQLSVQTNVDEIYGGQYTMSPFEAFPMGENIDPQQQRNAIVGLVSYLMDENQDPINRLKALSELNDQIKKMASTFGIDDQSRLEIIRVLINLPMQLGPHFNQLRSEYMMRKCLSSLYFLLGASRNQVMENQLIYKIYKFGLSQHLVNFIGHCFYTKPPNVSEAIVILSSLLENYYGEHFRQLVINSISVGTLMSLSSLSTKNSILWNCIRRLLRGKDSKKGQESISIKKQFIEQFNGVEWCIEQLRKDAAEKNLLVIMSILNFVSNYDPKVLQQIIDLRGIQIISRFLSHGSPNLLYEAGKFFQCMGVHIKQIQFNVEHIHEAIEKSVQLFGANDLQLINYLSGFLCNFTFHQMAAHLVNQFNGIPIIIRLLSMLWYHYLPSATDDTSKNSLNESIDNLLFLLTNMTMERNDKPLGWRSTIQLIQHPHIMTMLLDVLHGVGVCLYSSRVVLLAIRLLKHSSGLLSTLDTIFNSKNEYNYVPTVVQLYQACIQPEFFKKQLQSKQPGNIRLLYRLLELLVLMCGNPRLKMNIGLMLRQPAYHLVNCAIQCAIHAVPDLMLYLLDLMDALADDPNADECWSTLYVNLKQNPVFQSFATNQQIHAKVNEVHEKIAFYFQSQMGYSQEPQEFLGYR